MNVQHLESLSDLVASITGVTVREIVPDTVLKRADEVLLVDLPPAELIERFKEGKVYLPGNAERAAEGFFKPANLTALRELALRRTADRVDDQMIDLLRQSAIEGPWATGERLLVCVGPDSCPTRSFVPQAGWLQGLMPAGSSSPHADQRRGGETSKRIDELLDLAERSARKRDVSSRKTLSRKFSVSHGVRTYPDRRRAARNSGDSPIPSGGPCPTRSSGALPISAFISSRVKNTVPLCAALNAQAPRANVPGNRIPVVTGVTTLLGLGASNIVHPQNLSMLFLVAVILSA